MPSISHEESRKILSECKTELKDIKIAIQSIGQADSRTAYFIRYALIKVHGTIEQCYKNILGDFCDNGAKVQMKSFLDKSFRRKALNLKYDKLLESLASFDKEWKNTFKKKFSRHTDSNQLKIKTSLSSLVDARNEFAHGKNPTISFKDVNEYFKETEKIIKILDKTIR